MSIERAATKPSESPAKSLTGWVVELLVIVAIALGLALGIQAFVVKPYRIPERLDGTDPHRSASACSSTASATRLRRTARRRVSVFHPPAGAEEQECGPTPHTVNPAARRVRSRCRRSRAKTSSSGSSPAREMRSTSAKATSIRKAAGTTHFVREKDPYIKACGGSSECNFPTPITIPAGHWFMMGDNRGDSDDSRFWGPVPTGWIIGQVIVTYWPPDRIGIF